MPHAKSTVVEYKLYTEGRIFTGSASHVLGIVRYITQTQPGAKFDVYQVSQKLVSIRYVKKQAGGK